MKKNLLCMFLTFKILPPGPWFWWEVDCSSATPAFKKRPMQMFLWTFLFFPYSHLVSTRSNVSLIKSQLWSPWTNLQLFPAFSSTLLTLNYSFLASAASCILSPRTPSRNPDERNIVTTMMTMIRIKLVYNDNKNKMTTMAIMEYRNENNHYQRAGLKPIFIYPL